MKEKVISNQVVELEYDSLYELRYHIPEMLIGGYTIIATRRVSKIKFAITYMKERANNE